MSAILTFVASDPKNTPLTAAHTKETRNIAEFYNIEVTGKATWLAKNKAADIVVSDKPSSALLAHLREMLDADKIDVFISAPGNRKKRLLLADMDSTIVTSETLDELAEFAGLKAQIAEITAAAMEGKLDFHEALRERVGLLKGLETSALQETLDDTVINPGAKTLVKTMQAHDASCVLVSGGFTFFTGAIAEDVGFDHHHGNILDIEDEKLTGTVSEPILDKFAKVDFLDEYCEKLALNAEDCMTIGDGANDIPMLKKAGFGVGYKPKDAVAAEIPNLIIHGDLDAALYAQGYTDKEIIKE